MHHRTAVHALAAATMGLAWALASAPAIAQEAYVSYDDFQAGPIDPGRWITFERSRSVAGDGLNLTLREYGATSSDVDTAKVSWGDDLTNPLPVTQLRAQLRVNAVDVTGCAGNASTSRIRARMLATFFNTGNPTAGNFLGDVLAQVFAYRDAGSADAPGVLRVGGSAFVCNSSDCLATTQIGSFQDLGTLNIGQNTVLQLEWDKAGKRIVFTRDNGAATGSVSYTQTDALQPARHLKTLQIRSEIENCTIAPRPYGAMDVRWDNVSVNTSAKP